MSFNEYKKYIKLTINNNENNIITGINPSIEFNPVSIFDLTVINITPAINPPFINNWPTKIIYHFISLAKLIIIVPMICISNISMTIEKIIILAILNKIKPSNETIEKLVDIVVIE